MAKSRFDIEASAYVTGLIAIAVVAWVASRGPLSALLTSVGALAWSAIVALTLWVVLRHLNPGETLPPFPAPGVAVWFAPATILILDFAPLQVIAGLIVAVGTARMLCMPSARRRVGGTYRNALAGVIGTGELPVDLVARHFVIALVVAVGLQAGAASYLIHDHYRAAGLLVMSTAMLTAVIIGRGAWSTGRSSARWVVALAIMVLVAVIDRPVPNAKGYGTAAAAGPVPKTAPYEEGSQTELPATPGVNVPGGFPGVILWPEVKPVTLLIDPRLVGKGALASATRPLTIPFGGEYWMYRLPFLRPPRNSFFQRGTPVTLHFETTDRARLQMEARQKLTRSLSARCCSRLEVAVQNADKYAGTLALEMLIAEGTSAESLGSSMLTARSDGKTPFPETLTFQFPSAPRLDEFDELRVVFHMAIARADQSARVAIERFVLVPH